MGLNRMKKQRFGKEEPLRQLLSEGRIELEAVECERNVYRVSLAKDE